MRLLLARRPDRLDARHSIIEDEFIDLNLDSKNRAVTTMIGMLRDLHQNGRNCQFIKPLKGLPLYELKPNVRGGQKGGARIYFWLLPDDAAGIVNCEVKENDAPASQHKLMVALEVFLAHQGGTDVFSRSARSGSDLVR